MYFLEWKVVSECINACTILRNPSTGLSHCDGVCRRTSYPDLGEGWSNFVEVAFKPTSCVGVDDFDLKLLLCRLKIELRFDSAASPINVLSLSLLPLLLLPLLLLLLFYR